MKVVLVTPRYPPRVGGVEAHVQALATHLADRGHDVTVVATDRREREPARESVQTTAGHEVKLHRLRSFAPGEALHVAPGVLSTVRRLAREADAVHAHNYHSLPLSFAVLAASGVLGGPGTPVVVTPHYHGTGSTGFTDRLLSLYRPLGKQALARADARICVSEWARARLVEDFGLDATIIPNGLDVARFAEATPYEHDRPYLLSVGRLAPYKGVDHAIRALPDLAEYDLLIAGDGEARADLERVAREAGVADRVEFLGYVDDDRLPGLYAGAAAFLSFSTVEAYGMTVAESLASGTPCVVREAAALSEWTARDDCVGVPGDDVSPATLAAAVREASARDAPTDPLPDWDTVTGRVLDCYESMQR
jgi:glycosyltransferase involved in cell wall biosynthesis